MKNPYRIETRACVSILSLLLIFSAIPLAYCQSQQYPYPHSQVIKSITFDWSTHIRLAPGSDNWPLTWADDNHQYTAWGDGGGFGGTNSMGRSSIGVARIEGNWQDFHGTNIWGGYETMNPNDITGKSYGMISVSGTLYMWVGMFRTDNDQFDKARIAISTDHGASWKFSNWAFTRKEGIMMPTVCNFGRDYNGAKDEYLYVYLIRFQSYEGPDDYPDKVDWLNVQKPGMIDLARVHKDSIMSRSAYGFYAGDVNGKPVWTGDIMDRKPVFENPAGVGWCINVIFNQGLSRYLLTTEHTETHRGNIGIFDAPEPWGPWTTVLYEKNWGDGYIAPNTFYWNFSNKWTCNDGTEFSFVFTGRKENDSFNVIRGEFSLQQNED